MSTNLVENALEVAPPLAAAHAARPAPQWTIFGVILRLFIVALGIVLGAILALFIGTSTGWLDFGC